MRIEQKTEVAMVVSFMLAAALLLPGGAVAEPTACCAKRPDPARTDSAQAEFTERINQYVELRRVFEPPLGPEQLCADPEELQRAADALAASLRDARATARIGDIFTPRVAEFFRAEIAMVVRHSDADVAALLDVTDEEGLANAPRQPEINGRFPWGAAHIMWPPMLGALPLLPEEVEYRIVGPDLVLLDVRANMVVDILENAFPPARHGPVAPAGPANPGPPRGPCDVHPELATCWME